VLKSYLRTALRFLWQQKSYTFLNLLGLAVGLACSFLIFLWVQDELRYDQFHNEGDQIHRVMRNYFTSDGKVFTWSAIPMPLADVLREEYPEITHTVLMTWKNEALVATEEEAFREQGRYVGPAFFEVFSFPLVRGAPETALTDPNAIVISASLARKYFGPDWQEDGAALGQPLRVDNRKTFTVTGVFEDVPAHSSLRFDYVLPIADFVQRNDWLESWGNNALRLFVRLHDAARSDVVSAKITDVIEAHHEESRAALFLQAYPDMHLHSDFENGELVGGRIEYVRMFTIVAIFILLIASINFMNLSTARSAQRAREIGVRKAMGATRNALARQFVGESVGMALAALVVAVAVVALCLPGFNALTGKAVALSHVFSVGTLTFFLSIAVGTGLLASSYPALYLASFDVAAVLRGGSRDQARGGGFRRGLVVFQFAMSILLIIGTVTVYQQIDYIRTKNLGLDRDNLVHLTLEGDIRTRYDAFKQELERQPGIASVTVTDGDPLSISNSTSDPTWQGKDPDSEILFHVISVGHDFIETTKMEMAAGRSFSKAFGADSLNYLVNEAAARAMGMEEPLGEALTFWEQTGEIIGVVEDFHMTSLYAPIEPTIIRLDRDRAWRLYVRTEPGATEAALANLEALYKTFNPSYPFEYRFVDESYEHGTSPCWPCLLRAWACLGWRPTPPSGARAKLASARCWAHPWSPS
jgi:hypothetical protein